MERSFILGPPIMLFKAAKSNDGYLARRVAPEEGVPA
jgi:hypothetical protein